MPAPPHIHAETAAHVIAVVVTYQPDTAVLERLLAQLAPQVQYTVIVDNTESTRPVTPMLAPRQTLLHLGKNTGIGHAQNLGMAKARQLGATHVLLMDQDSLPPANLVSHQLQTLASVSTDTVAAIGPLCRDVKTGQTTPLIQRHGWSIRRLHAEGLVAPIPVEYIPASGALIPLHILERVGPMRAEYFIDRVDVEWCLRARHMGLIVWVDPRSEMLHNQATHAIKVLGRTLYVGHNFRRYFHVRNSVAMALRASIPLFWRLDQLLKTPFYMLLYTVVAQTGRLRMVGTMLTAVLDGLRGRMGRGHYEHRPLR